MSLSNVTQFNTAIGTTLDSTVIPLNGAGVAPQYIYGSAVEQGVELSINNYGTVEAFRVVDGGLGADGVSATATEMLTTEAVTEGGVVTGTNVVKFPAKTTGAGTVKAGALSASVPIGYVAGGIAIGAGIGLKEVATHRQFWNDLVTLGDGINTPSETIRVIWRALEDGGIQSYCDKRSVDQLIANMYALDAFNVIDKIDTTVTQPGSQTITIAGMGEGIAMAACEAVNMSVRPDVVTSLYSMGSARYSSSNVMAVYARRGYQYSPTLGGEINIRFFNIPSTVTIQQDSNGFQAVYTRDYFVGAITGGIEEDGTLGTYSFRDYSSLSDNSFYVGQSDLIDGNIVNASNAGAIFTPKNPHVIYNGTDLLPPENIEDFWTTFSDWLANGFEQPGYNPWNNTITPTTWIPFTFPIDTNWQVQPVTGVQPDIWTGEYELPEPYPEPDPDPEPQPVPVPNPWIWPSFDKIRTPDPNPEPPEPDPWDKTPEPNPEPPIGDPPVTIVDPTSVVGSSDALFSVYNPTQAQINSLGSYLWTNNIIDLISQFFQNPLDAIISLHVVYCTPSTSGTKNIKLGYLDSGVSASIVTSQYKTIDCGNIAIPEVYHNALDYTGVKLNLFLPFIGFREISTKECMGAKLNVQYKIDIYTGTCLAMIYVIRPNVRQLLYTFEGNCSVQVPLTGADRSRLVAGLVTAGVSAFTGNPAGVIGGIASISANIERSGAFSGNAGAMGVKKPYLVINRCINAQADGYNSMYGFPLNKKTKLIQLKGFTRVQSIHVDIPDATHDELIEIHNQLTAGIVI